MNIINVTKCTPKNGFNGNFLKNIRVTIINNIFKKDPYIANKEMKSRGGFKKKNTQVKPTSGVRSRASGSA